MPHLAFLWCFLFANPSFLTNFSHSILLFISSFSRVTSSSNSLPRPVFQHSLSAAIFMSSKRWGCSRLHEQDGSGTSRTFGYIPAQYVCVRVVSIFVNKYGNVFSMLKSWKCVSHDVCVCVCVCARARVRASRHHAYADGCQWPTSQILWLRLSFMLETITELLTQIR